MHKDTAQWAIPALLAVGVALALWFYWSATDHPAQPAETVVEEPAPPPESAASPGPVHPIREPVETTAARPSLRPLPPLDQSDEYFRLALADLFGESLARSLADSRLIERLVATVDNLPREYVAQRMRPVTGVEGPFLADDQDDSGEYRLNPDNYRRYDALVSLLANADTSELADIYRRFFPLLQKAYVNLGYPDGYFNDRVVEVIDHLLETPDVSEPPALVRPHVLYEFADPGLEGLSSGQKLLIRIGPEHRRAIEKKLREFRALIA